MRQRTIPFAVVLSIFCTLTPPLSTFAADTAEEELSVVDRYIVTLKDDANQDDLLRKFDVKRLKVFTKALKGFAAKLDGDQLKKLREDPQVAAIEPDVIVHTAIDWNKWVRERLSSASSSKKSSSSRSSSSSSSSSSSKSSSSIAPSSSSASTSQITPTGISRIGATAKIDGNDDALDVDVAIIDTGIQLNHPDLRVYRDVNLVNPSRTGNDDNGHGTHVAGIAAAIDNKTGVVGVAPGARLWAVKVMGSNGSGYMSDIIEGVDYVTQHAGEIEVANMSLGCECVSEALNQALNRSIAAGVVYVVAAGNNGKDSSTYYPASHPDVITVSAIADFDGKSGGLAGSTCRSDEDDTLADFSNYGSPVDIAAPGVCIRSTYKGSKYSLMSGTSMASPHVAGAAALYITTHGNPGNSSDVAAIKNALQGVAFEQSSGDGFSGDKDSFAESLLNALSL